ncbi:MAG: hypothetical protein SNJ75_04980 [Gemmataceae bacterium]
MFDRSALRIQPLAQRVHDLDLSSVLALEAPVPSGASPHLPVIAQRLRQARERGRARIWLMGAHVLRAGTQRVLIDLMDRGLISHLAMNGAGPIHDYEMALIGATTESVARYISSGEFGLWHETGQINDLVREGITQGMGLGESLGRAILDGAFPHKDISILAQAAKRNIPVTVHVGIGQDILHEHPNFDGAVFGQASYMDFLIFARTVQTLENGVYLNFGSAVMGPEVYLKALAMARNVAHQQGERIAHFTTAVFDLIPISGDPSRQAPKTDPQYYYRPWKTILVRTVADGGESFYIQGDHRATIPQLRQAILEAGG